MVRKRSGGYRLIEMEDRVGSGNVGGPDWKARPIGIAVGREVHPVLRDDFFETAVGIGPGPVWRHKISKHIGKFGAVISSKILPKVLDIGLIRRCRRMMREVIIKDLRLAAARLRLCPSFGERGWL